MKSKIVFFALAISSSLASFSQSVTLNISGIENTDGLLQVAIFENSKQFEDEIPAQTLYYKKSNISNGKKDIKLDLKSGNYAITVLDDEDNSKDMTFRFGIYPKEGIGFSNYKIKGLSKPDFEDFDFKVTEGNKPITVEIQHF